jgi:hypothetical protein
MVSGKDEGGDANLIKAPHHSSEVESGPHVAPVAVEEVAGEDDEVDRLIDRKLNEIVEGRPCGRTDARKLFDEDDRSNGGWPPHRGSDDDDEAMPLPALYTASVVHADERGAIYVYAAMIADSAGEVRRRLRARLGPLLEDAARVRLGFDWSEPLACAMVSDAAADMLALVSADPTSPIARGLDFQVEQRFAC